MAYVGKRIRYLRKSENLTQQELAAIIGVAKSTISMYENDQREPDFETLEAIADYFNVDMNYLTGWVSDPYDYETDPDNRFSEIPSAQYKQLDKEYNHDLATMWQVWCNMQRGTAREAVHDADKISRATPQQSQFPKGAEFIDLSEYHQIPILGRISAGLPLYAEEHIEGYTLTDLNGGAEYFGLRVRGDSMNALRINDGDIIIVRRQEEVEQGEVAVVLVDGEDATVKRFYSSNTTVTLMPQSTNPEHKPQMYDLSKTAIRVLGRVVEVKFLI